MGDNQVRILLAVNAESVTYLHELLTQIKDVACDLNWLSDYEAALEVIRHCEHDIYFVDYGLEGHEGLELLNALDPRCMPEIVFLMDHIPPDLDTAVISAGAVGSLEKAQIDAPTIERIVRRVLRRKAVSDALRASEERLRQVIQDMPVMMVAFDQDAINILVWNRECERVTGYSAGEIVGNPSATQLLYPDKAYRNHLRAEWRKYGDNYRNLEWDITCKDGSVRTVSWSNLSDRFPVPGWATWGIGVDVTERRCLEEALRQAHDELERRVEERTAELAHANALLREHIAERERAEAALRASEERLRQVIQNMPVMLMAWGEDTAGVSVWNRECERVTGFKAEEIVGNPDYVKLLYPDRAYRIWLDREWRRRGDDYRDLEWDITCKDGSVRTVSWSNISDRFPIPGWETWAIGVDVTERKQAEQRALALAVELERIKVLEQFIGAASHDLNTPIASMKLSLSVMKRSSDLEMRQRHLENLEIQTARLEKMVQDMLNAIRPDQASAMALKLLDLNALAQVVVEEHESLAARKQQTLSFSSEVTLLPVEGDEDGLKHALTALVTNALNYTPNNGAITVRTYARDSHAIIEVRDTGKGISAIDLPHVFERFYRADLARSLEEGGMGLGLAIAKDIVEAHQGRIEVESAPGAGSVFRVYLPLSDEALLNG